MRRPQRQEVRIVRVDEVAFDERFHVLARWSRSLQCVEQHVAHVGGKTDVVQQQLRSEQIAARDQRGDEVLRERGDETRGHSLLEQVERRVRPARIQQCQRLVPQCVPVLGLEFQAPIEFRDCTREKPEVQPGDAAPQVRGAVVRIRSDRAIEQLEVDRPIHGHGCLGDVGEHRPRHG